MCIIKAVGLSVKLNSKNIIDKISFEIRKEESWAIVGPSGSGKTTLLHTLAGMQFHSGLLEIENGLNVSMVEQQHKFKNLSNTSNFYYQQRFNSCDAEDALTVEEYLAPLISSGVDIHSGVFSILGIPAIWDRKLIQLSNGENKRLQIARSMLLHPGLLLLDGPLVGLDVNTRNTMELLLANMIAEGIHIIMVTSRHTIPSFITHVLELDGEGRAKTWKKQDFVTTPHQEKHPFSLDVSLLKKLNESTVRHEFDFAVKMNNVNISYGAKEILKKVSWEIREGERWALSGPNGAGKSTLLSLITGDNPQAYSNEIYLFDKRRGSGESIWDIKKKIGYVSPELHLYFPVTSSVFETIASGLFDTIGLFRQLTEVQIQKITGWVNLFGMQAKRHHLLRQLSASEQRLTLLARALIKNPALLILDEPAQGLDEEQSRAFKVMIDEICTHSNKTLIYVSHWQEEIPNCVDHFIRLEGGEVVE